MEFWRWVSLDLLFTSHRCLLGKENHFKNDATWVGDLWQLQSRLSCLLPKPLKFQSSHHYRATSSTHTQISLCHLRVFHKNILYSWRACWSVFLGYISENIYRTPQPFANVKNKRVKPFIWTSTQWAPVNGTSTIINQQTCSL